VRCAQACSRHCTKHGVVLWSRHHRLTQPVQGMSAVNGGLFGQLAGKDCLCHPVGLPPPPPSPTFPCCAAALGTLPPSWSGMAALKTLDLSANAFNGEPRLAASSAHLPSLLSCQLALYVHPTHQWQTTRDPKHCAMCEGCVHKVCTTIMQHSQTAWAPKRILPSSLYLWEACCCGHDRVC
jgi:hypothetical protein